MLQDPADQLLDSAALGRLLDQAATSYSIMFEEFGGIDELIDSARLSQVTSRTRIAVDMLDTAIAQATTYDEAIAGLCTMAQIVSDPQFAADRVMRTAVIGSTLTRPEIRQAVAEMQHHLTTRFTQSIADGERRGLYRCATPPRAIAVFVQAFTAGQIIDEMDYESTPLEDWTNTADHALRGLLLPNDDPPLSDATSRAAAGVNT